MFAKKFNAKERDTGPKPGDKQPAHEGGRGGQGTRPSQGDAKSDKDKKDDKKK